MMTVGDDYDGVVRGLGVIYMWTFGVWGLCTQRLVQVLFRRLGHEFCSLHLPVANCDIHLSV